MTLRRYTLRRCLCFALAALPLAGQAAPALPTPLSAALLRAVPPRTGVVLAVDAAKVPLPPDAVLPGDAPTVRAVGAIYGRSVVDFGAVTAVIPPTVTVVYAPPETPNPYDGMPPGQVMSLLAKTFTPAQWKAFLSPTGVAYATMTGDTQAALFGALFPDGHLKVIQDNPIGENDPKTKQDLSGDVLTAAHLRLGFIVSMALQMESEPTSHLFAAGLRPANSPPRYFMTNAQDDNVDHELGATVRESVPNTLKAGQMALDASALKAAVPLSGIKTVDDLMTRIGVTTKHELYADARYGTRPITLLPANGSAPAADLLRALAVCVGGTYRQVGPAFVLTDDVTGLGTKHALWKAFEEKAAAMLPGGGGFIPATAAGPDVPYTVQDIPFGDDPLAFTAAQKDGYWKEWAKRPSQTSSPTMDITVPFDQLTPAQQNAAQLIQADNEKSDERTTLNGKVMVQAEPEVEIILPALDGPAVIFQSYQSLLPYPKLTAAEEKTQAARMAQEFSDIALPDAPPPPAVSEVLRGFARRAARIAPPAPEKTAETFRALKALGFTEVWLQILPDPSAPDTELKTRLAQTVAAGQKSGLMVIADLSLLRWGSADKSLVDLDLRGRPGSTQTVTPFAPAVSARLEALVRTVGSVPGLGGMVWNDLRPLGYQGSVFDDSDSPALGYNEAGRLAYLRQAHADPVDLYPAGFVDSRAHVSVPNFSDDDKNERRLYAAWQKARAGAATDLTRRLIGALPPPFTRPAGRLPLLLAGNGSIPATSYASWDDLSRPTPEGATSNTSALAYTCVTVYWPPAPSLAEWKAGAARALAVAAKRGSRNVVLDMTKQSALLEDKKPYRKQKRGAAKAAPHSFVSTGPCR